MSSTLRSAPTSAARAMPMLALKRIIVAADFEGQRHIVDDRPRDRFDLGEGIDGLDEHHEFVASQARNEIFRPRRALATARRRRE